MWSLNKLIILNLILFLNINCHIEQIVPFESTQFESFQDECPACEQLYQWHNAFNNLDNNRKKIIENLKEWLKKANLQEFHKEQIQSLIDVIERDSDLLLSNLAADNKVEAYLNSLSTNIYKLDHYLPEDQQLEQHDYFEILKEIRYIYQQLRITNVPDQYDRWLAKRMKMQ